MPDFFPVFVDGFTASFYCELAPEHVQRACTLLEYARDPRTKNQPVNWAGLNLDIAGAGREIFLIDRQHGIKYFINPYYYPGVTHPQFRVEVMGHGCYLYDWVDFVAQFRAFLRRANLCVRVEAVKMSRLDIAADFLMERRCLAEFRDLWVKRSSDRQFLDVCEHGSGAKLKEFEFGSRGAVGVHMKLYDKTRDMLDNPSKRVILPKFEAVGWKALNPDSPVYRLEASLGAEPLKQFSASFFEHASAPQKLGNIWGRLFGAPWAMPAVRQEALLSLRVHGDGRLRDRPLHPFWLRVIGAAGVGQPTERTKTVNPQADQLVLQAIGCLRTASRLYGAEGYGDAVAFLGDTLEARPDLLAKVQSKWGAALQVLEGRGEKDAV